MQGKIMRIGALVIISILFLWWNSDNDLHYCQMSSLCDWPGRAKPRLEPGEAQRYYAVTGVAYSGGVYQLKDAADVCEAISHRPPGWEDNPFVEEIVTTALVVNTNNGTAVPQGSGKSYSVKGQLIYEGQWLQGYKHGTGQEYYENGALKYIGGYDRGLWSGYGTLYHEDSTGSYKLYEGEFCCQSFHGQGTEFDKTGAVIYDGLWYYGEPIN